MILNKNYIFFIFIINVVKIIFKDFMSKFINKIHDS